MGLGGDREGHPSPHLGYAIQLSLQSTKENLIQLKTEVEPLGPEVSTLKNISKYMQT